MKIKETPETYTITFSAIELMTLARLFGNGIMIGVIDPFIDMDDEIERDESKTIESLIKEGIIKEDGPNQYLLDEIIGGMIYSITHSESIMVVKDKIDNRTRYFHFLPEWQLELVNEGEEYSLTLLRNKDMIWPYITQSLSNPLSTDESGTSFAIKEKDLELAISLYGNGQVELANRILIESSLVDIGWDSFLKGYDNPINHLVIETINQRNNPERLIQRIRMVIQTGNSLYWVMRGKPAQDDPFFLEFEPVTPEEIATSFNYLLPH